MRGCVGAISACPLPFSKSPKGSLNARFLLERAWQPLGKAVGEERTAGCARGSGEASESPEFSVVPVTTPRVAASVGVTGLKSERPSR